MQRCLRLWFYILFFCWVVVVAVTSMTSAVIGVCLIGHFNNAGLIPNMPYLSALIFGICFLAFSLFLAAASYYFLAYTKQIVRASVRWHRNMTSPTTLPPLSWNPQFTNKTRRTLRGLLLWSVTIFGVSAALAFVVSELLSGTLGFLARLEPGSSGKKQKMKTIVITGATSGIGFETARILTQQGTPCDRNWTQ